MDQFRQNVVLDQRPPVVRLNLESWRLHRGYTL